MIKGPECCEVSFDSPSSLRYITYNISSDSATVRYGEHQDTFSLRELPEGSVIRLLALSVDTVLFKTHSFTFTDEGTVKNQTVILGQNADVLFSIDGDLKRIDFPDSDFSVLFNSL